MGRLLVLPLERRALRRQRLRRRHDQPARLHRLRPGHRRRRQRRLGRQALHRPDDRPRLRRAALSLHRQDPRVRPRRQLRRLHGQLGPRPHRPLQVHRHATTACSTPSRPTAPRRRLWFNEWEFKGKPWDYYGKPDSENPFRKWSPALSAKNFKTPTLVVHGQLDYRLDVSEGFQLFDHPAAPRRAEQDALLPRRGPLGAEAAELPPLVEDGERLGGPVDEVKAC